MDVASNENPKYEGEVRNVFEDTVFDVFRAKTPFEVWGAIIWRKTGRPLLDECWRS